MARNLSDICLTNIENVRETGGLWPVICRASRTNACGLNTDLVRKAQVARTKCAPNAHLCPPPRIRPHGLAPGCIRSHYLVDKYYCAKYITYATHDFYKSYRGGPAAFVLQGLGCWLSFFALPLDTPCCVHLGYETSIHQTRHP